MPRFAGHHVPAAQLGLFAAESSIVLGAALAGYALAAGATVGTGPALLAAGACGASVLLAFYLLDLYDTRVAGKDLRDGRRMLLALGAVMLAAAPVLLLAPAGTRAGVPMALAAAAIGAAGLRALAPWRALCPRVLIVGEGDALISIEAELETDGGDEILAAIDPTTPDLLGHARAARADVIVIAAHERRGLSHEALLACRLAGIEVMQAAEYVERTRRKVPIDLIRPASLIYGDGFQRSRLGDSCRRLLSLAAAIVLGVLTAPVMAVVAVLVKRDSRGPAIYRQIRVGKGGRPFTVCKFRTMSTDAEARTGAVWAQVNDPRVTRIGGFLRKTRLDELPQLWNVIRGDMDLVGPRPERPEFVAELERSIPFFNVRALVRPGLTGWAQIRYRYGASIEDTRHKLGFDLYYVKHASPLLDAIVLFHTAKTVLFGRGAR